ncbi:mps one binder kinase activator-like 3-like protein [Cricetulus griseus]|uniref:Mps one binder kinase activator-like 3-like protein n=1 Tax=Cricetulus griseus TaxID=10029 RepID=A0A061IJQ3_CRIGR|nr:mps one binder kinase activator-like 3-like protein [Cricetulus griseus]
MPVPLDNRKQSRENNAHIPKRISIIGLMNHLMKWTVHLLFSRQFCLELNGLAVKLQCPAIDYTRHTLDGAACLLNSNKYFPSRVSIKESSVAKLGSVCRRIYRIFSHAYFHHRQIFDEYENETFLCHRFTKFVMKYNLMSKDNLIVPILEEEVQNSVSGESEA